eukprot:TRINITY_DN1338_c0_g1_i1.p1 TRINITY_DN1338_c0_g1~~TRINITY_DN1338_c0_g1_i1.p1  ORF type:complete len:462 (+),score=78.76 TRINITY_DN1338_c0_g1_i1:81-1388(+)
MGLYLMLLGLLQIVKLIVMWIRSCFEKPKEESENGEETERFIEQTEYPQTNLKGIDKIGLTCYFCAILQCIVNTPHLEEALIQKQEKIKTRGLKYHSALLEFIKQYRESRQAIDPMIVFEVLCRANSEYSKKKEADAREALNDFLRLILDEEIESERELKSVENQIPNTIIGGIYCFSLASKTVCDHCSSVSWTTEHRNFTLPVPICGALDEKMREDHEQAATIFGKTYLIPRKKSIYPRKTIESTLQAFFQEELVSDYICSRCSEKVVVRKQSYFLSPPQVLIVNLKRYSCENGKTIKDADFIKINHTIYLDEYILIEDNPSKEEANPDPKEQKIKYELFGIVKHKGELATTGHYTAYVKDNGDWYLLNDTHINLRRESLAINRGAYLVFYQRVQEPTKQSFQVSPLYLFINTCLLYTSPSPRDATLSRMPSSA